MPIELMCPLCESQVRVPDTAAGEVVRCPECRGRIKIPAAEPEHDDLTDAVRRAPRASGRRASRALALVAVGSILATLAIVGALAWAGVLPRQSADPVGPESVVLPPPSARPAPVIPGVAPAPEEADPFQPADPQAALALKELDQLAEALLAVPQDTERLRAVRAARARWQAATMDEAFDRFGRADAPWAAKARTALRMRAAELAALGSSGLSWVTRDASESALADAVAGGCDDPLVLYYHRKALLRSGQATLADARREDPRVAALLCESRYPDVRKLYAAHNALVTLSASAERGAGAETRAWDARYWALLATVAATNDPVTQEHITELADLREQYLIATGVTRERAHEEFVDHLSRAKAPESTVLTVKGAFLVRHGWDARGSGFASTVTDEGRRLLGERMEAAEAALTAAHEAAPDLPQTATQMLLVCKGRGHDRETMEQWFARALRADPDNVAACHRKLEYLHPKWYGTQGEYLGFAWQCVRTRNTAGQLPYAPVANILANVPLPDEMTPGALAQLQPYYSHPQIWNLLNVALTVLRQEHPDRLWVRGLHARIACVAGRYDVAVRELAAVGNDHRGGGFRTEGALAFYRTWTKELRLPGAR